MNTDKSHFVNICFTMIITIIIIIFIYRLLMADSIAKINSIKKL